MIFDKRITPIRNDIAASDYKGFLKNRKFIKTLSKFTSHCKVFINMIKDKENIDYYFEKKEREFKTDFENNDSRIEDMVNYYNSNCG